MRRRSEARGRRSRSWRAAPAAADRRLASAGDCSGVSRTQTRAARGGIGRQPIRAALAALALLLLSAGPAGAQLTGPYQATPPTKGALYPDGQDDRYLLGGAWLYQADPSDVGRRDGWWRNNPSTAGWAPVTIPNSFNAGDLSQASAQGSVGWYRRDFTLPAGAFASYVPTRFRSWIVRFESVNYDATVWLNGRLIGHHDVAYLPFELALKGVHPGVNRLTVRVDSRRTAASFPPGPVGNWWNFGGIQREVYLRAVQRSDLSLVQVRPRLPCPTCAARIAERATVTNPTARPQTVILHGVYGGQRLNFGAHTIPPGGAWIAHASTVLRTPHLWSPSDPYLYQATLSLDDAAGRPLEGYFTNSGVRSVTVDSSGQVLINGRVLNARGFSIHEQNVATGAALDPSQLAAFIGWERELGATILRAHYPLNPQILQLADQDGILVWSEIPVYQSSSSYLANRSWLASAHALLRENILVNQNHPSIMLWSIANELPAPPPPSEARYVAGASAIAHQLDPTRPVAMAISGWPGIRCQPAYAPLDIIGYNDYFGWFDAGGGATDDRDSLGPYLDGLHACYPSKGLMVSEFGFEANRSGPVEERGTYAFQADAARYHLGVFASKPYLSGAIWFALQTFAARPGGNGGDPLGTPPFVQKGAIDLYGNHNPLFGVLQAIYRSTVQLGAPVGSHSRHRARRARARHSRRRRSR